jgi:hypothetical protein
MLKLEKTTRIRSSLHSALTGENGEHAWNRTKMTFWYKNRMHLRKRNGGYHAIQRNTW